MKLSRYLAFTAVLFAFAAPACSGDTVSSPGGNTEEDAGSPDSATQDSATDDSSEDTSKDSGVDSSKDSGVDSATDSSADVAKDQQADTKGDSNSDASADTTTDTGVADTSTDSSKDSSGDVATDTTKDTGGDVIACTPLTGLGAVTCPCGKPNSVEWSATTSPFYFDSHLDFGTTGWDSTQLTAGGKIIFAEPNLGGNSVESEVAAYEMLARCDFAALIKTESQIDYKDAAGKKTDVLVQIDGLKVGVSVVRAYHYPPTDPYTPAEATKILTKKLTDIPLSAANAKDYDAWARSILAVMAYDQKTADTVKAAWEALDPALRGNVILYLTVTDGVDTKIYN